MLKINILKVTQHINDSIPVKNYMLQRPVSVSYCWNGVANNYFYTYIPLPTVIFMLFLIKAFHQFYIFQLIWTHLNTKNSANPKALEFLINTNNIFFWLYYFYGHFFWKKIIKIMAIWGNFCHSLSHA